MQLEIVEFDVTRLSRKETRPVREHFNTRIKSLFYQNLARQEPQALLKAGLTVKQILAIAEMGFYDAKIEIPNKFKRFNIDHIRGICWGGTNDLSNLCFIPAAVNNYKGRIECQQTENLEEGETATITTIAPARRDDGRYLSHVTMTIQELRRQSKATVVDFGARKKQKPPEIPTIMNDQGQKKVFTTHDEKRAFIDDFCDRLSKQHYSHKPKMNKK